MAEGHGLDGAGRGAGRVPEAPAGPQRGRPLVVVSVLPPPRTGQTLVTEAMVARLAARLDLRLFAVRNEAGARGLRWTLAKHARQLGALLVAGLRIRGRAEGRADVYVVPDAGGGLWFNVVQAVVMRALFRRVWFHHHVFSYVRVRDARMAAIHRILGPRLHHIALGRAMAEGLERHYGARNITVLNNAPFVEDVPAPRDGIGARPALRQVGFLGNITREKGIGLFMETVAAAQARAPSLAPSLRAVIAGPIADLALRAEVEAFCAAAPGTRRWIGPVQGADKAAFLDATDCLLFPSLYANEALPMTIYEALAAGIPVLATARGCIPDQLAGTGWVFAEETFAQDAAAQIEAWTTNPTPFSDASRQASQSFAAQQAEAMGTLETLVKEIGQRG